MVVMMTTENLSADEDCEFQLMKLVRGLYKVPKVKNKFGGKIKFPQIYF